MNEINKYLKQYIEKEILPIYEKNDEGHSVDHINYVANRCIKFAKQFDNIDINMIYVSAVFHDIAHHIDKDNHELLSAKIFYEDKKMKEFFNIEQRKIIKEAIEDHRSSLDHVPRNDYGKILSSADRTTNISMAIKRTHSYTKKHYPNLNLSEQIERAFKHINKKYGDGGYSKSYVIDEDYNKFLIDINNLLNDKNLFIHKYMDINGIKDIKSKAMLFAINAHMGQVRKSETDKHMIIHPIGVGNLLEEYGYNENIVAAGFLHDVVEDTKYTILDIEKYFGKYIASLVYGASEEDKSLSWEKRKRITIDKTKYLNLENKLIICADKINNLEDLMLKFQKSGVRDFSAFKRGESLQKWYYTNIYESLIYNEDKDLPIFKRLKNVLDVVFGQIEDNYLKNVIFPDNIEYYDKLKKLHAQKLELQKLKQLCSLPKPFVIEFSGTPRTGKTTTINNLYDFFKKGGFKVKLIEEFTTSKYYKENLKDKFSKMNLQDRNIAIVEEVLKQLREELVKDNEIILIDRSINDRQIWNYRIYSRGDISNDKYFELRDKYCNISSHLIDFLVVTYADPLVSLKRDYLCSLTLEKRNFLNSENIDEYNKCLNEVKDLLVDCVEDQLFLDTSSKNISDISIEVAENIMPVMRKKYINAFRKKYNLK